MSKRVEGNIATYNRDRGFGFIQSEAFATPIWFHFKRIIGASKSSLYIRLNEPGELAVIPVSFEVMETPQGLQAHKIEMVSPLSEIGEFLRETTPGSRANPSKLLQALTFEKVTQLDADAELTQLVVSKVIQSPERWASITELGQSWMSARLTLERMRPQSSVETRELTSFIEKVCEALDFNAKGEPDISPAQHVLLQEIRQPGIPLKCFRQADEVWLVVIPTIVHLQNLLNSQPSLVHWTRKSMRLVLILELETESDLLNNVSDSILKRLLILEQQTFLAPMLGVSSRQQALGKLFADQLQIHMLQPYEVSSAYSELVFSGRASERESILYDTHSNCAVYGGRKIGKTWFLKDICYRSRTDSRYRDEYFPIYVSLQVATNTGDAVALIEEAVKYELAKMRLRFPESKAEQPQNRLRYIIRKTHEVTEKTVILALDEIDDMLKSGSAYEFFGALRAVQETFPGAVKYVFAGFKELIAAFSKEENNMPFSNWRINHFSLGCLDEKDLRALIIEPWHWLGLEFRETEIVPHIFALTSGHPYYTQYICSQIVNRHLEADGHRVTKKSIDEVASEQFFDEIFDVFTANLSTLQLLIGKVFQGHTGEFTDEDIKQKLEHEFGIVVDLGLVREQMKVLVACSVFRSIRGGYRPLMERINEEFFKTKDGDDLALKHMEDSANAH